MRRRQLLAGVVVGIGGALGGCPDGGPGGTPSGGPTGQRTDSGSGRGTDSPTGDGPGTSQGTDGTRVETVDMVADRGVDPTGETPIDDDLADAAGSYTRLAFPPGEYLVTRPLLLEETTAFGIRGTGEDRGDVRFVHPEGYSNVLLDVRDGRDCTFENFTAVQTGDGVTNSGLVVRQRDGLVVTDVEVSGFTPTLGSTPDEEGSIDLVPQVLDPDGVGTVTRFVSTGGGEVGVYPNSYPGLYSGQHSRGTLELIDCRIADCGGAGLYASRAPGPVRIEGGRFWNNEVAQVRIAGEGSYIRDAEITVDTAGARNSRGEYETVRGLWWESGDLGQTGGVVENCTFTARSAPVSRGLLEVDGTAGAMTVRDTRFQVDLDGYHAVRAFPPGSSSMGGEPARPWGLTLENVTVTGEASDTVAIDVDGRPETRVTGIDVDQPGRDRDGLRVADSPGSRIAGSRLAVGGFPLRVPSASTSQDGRCGLEVGSDTVVRSTTWDRLPGDRVDVGSDPACLPATDGEGMLLVLDRCTSGLVAALVDGEPSRDGATEYDCATTEPSPAGLSRVGSGPTVPRS